MNKLSVLAVLVVASAMSQASFTVATFSDPATNSTTPMFTWDQSANTLVGSWGLPGLTMQTPGLIGGGSYANVTMKTSVISLTSVIANTFYTMGRGQVDFFDSSSAQLLTINFTSGNFLNPSNAGASDLTLNGVTFAGPNVPVGLTDRQFSFSFANPQTTGNFETFTASFTSSAVPEPTMMVAAGAGLVALVRRRRKS